MRQRVTAVAAANRHTVVLTDCGAVYSWGSNLQGQLGYGTSDSASNAVPRIVEAMKVSEGLIHHFARNTIAHCTSDHTPCASEHNAPAMLKFRILLLLHTGQDHHSCCGG